MHCCQLPIDGRACGVKGHGSQPVLCLRVGAVEVFGLDSVVRAVTASVADTPKARVLIVDDSEFARTLIAASAAPLDIELVCATSGLEALALCEQGAFELIITDLNMPGMSGLELIQAVRRESKCPSCHAFVVTTSPTAGMLHRGREVGVTAWILKPINPENLRIAMRRVLRLESVSQGMVSLVSVPPSRRPGRTSLQYGLSQPNISLHPRAPRAPQVPTPSVQNEAERQGLPRVMVISAEQMLVDGIMRVLRGLGQVFACANAQAALRELGQRDWAVVVVDLRGLVEQGGMLLRQVRHCDPLTVRVAVTDSCELEEALERVNREGGPRLLSATSSDHTLVRVLGEALESHRLAVDNLSLISGRVRTELSARLKRERSRLIQGLACTTGWVLSAAVQQERPGASGETWAQHGRGLGRFVADDSESANLSAVVSQLVHSARRQGDLNKSQVRLELEVHDLYVRMGTVQLAHLVEQLLSNALDSIQSQDGFGGLVEIRLVKAAEQKQVLLTVSDNGGGIGSAVLPRVFEPYFTTKPDALGLGLTAVAALAERVGAQVNVDSQLGCGTTVTVRLPLWADEKVPAEGEAKLCAY